MVMETITWVKEQSMDEILALGIVLILSSLLNFVPVPKFWPKWIVQFPRPVYVATLAIGVVLTVIGIVLHFT
jgi:uncharacterized protein YjeT (DUF2065 family)